MNTSAILPKMISNAPFIGESGYLALLQHILDVGVEHSTKRTGHVTKGIVAPQIHFDLTKGFPLLTTKKVPFSLVAAELLWFLEGGKETGGRLNVNRLRDLNNQFAKQPKERTIWHDDYESPSWQSKIQEEGDVGRIYGAQWRSWVGVDGVVHDQIANLISRLKLEASDRRALVSAWNPAELSQMVLPPCHVLFQVKILEGELSLIMYQRSADMFLGVPFNIASYALLAHLIAKILGVKATLLTINFGDAHIYSGHYEQVKEQISRQPLELPQLTISDDFVDFESLKPEHIKIENYQSHPALKATMAAEVR